jgi:hypothetical protein
MELTNPSGKEFPEHPSEFPGDITSIQYWNDCLCLTANDPSMEEEIDSADPPPN